MHRQRPDDSDRDGVARPPAGIGESDARARVKPVAVIPARWGSTRFPGKPLVQLAGRPLVVHVLEACRRSGAFSEVRVATDDERIAAAVSGAGGLVEMTRPEHPSGTDRVAEVAARLPPGVEVVVNVQGDEPLVDPEALRALLHPHRGAVLARRGRGPSLGAPRALRLPASDPAPTGHPRTLPARAHRVAGAASRTGAWHPDPLHPHGAREHRRRHARGPRACRGVASRTQSTPVKTRLARTKPGVPFLGSVSAPVHFTQL